MLEGREGFDEAGAALVDEEGGRGAAFGRVHAGFAQALQDFGPAVDAGGVGAAEGDAFLGILRGDGGAVVNRSAAISKL